MISLPCSVWVSAAWAQPLPHHSIHVLACVKASSQFRDSTTNIGCAPSNFLVLQENGQ